MTQDRIFKLQERFIEVALTFKDVKEEPLNSNRGKVIDSIQAWFGLKGEPYCIMFALYVWHLTLIREGYKIFPFLKTASTQKFLEWTKEKQALKTNPKLISPGDIVLYTKYTRTDAKRLWTPTRQGHAEPVISNCFDDFTFKTMGGNTQPDNASTERNGGGIHPKNRSAKQFELFPEKGTYALVMRGIMDCETILRAI